MTVTVVIVHILVAGNEPGEIHLDCDDRGLKRSTNLS